MDERGTELLSSRTNGWRDIALCHTWEDETLSFIDGEYQDNPQRHRRTAYGRPWCQAVTCSPGTPGD
jgi:hypothetical protein